MKQVVPHQTFPSGAFWMAGVLKYSPEWLHDEFGIEFEQGEGDLGSYVLAAIEDPMVDQFWLHRYLTSPHSGTEVLVDTNVLRDEAIAAVWTAVSIDIRGFSWVNPYQRYSALASGPDRTNPLAIEFLTPRETEVLHLVKSGATNAGIAQALGLKSSTVSTYQQRIAFKLGLHGVAGLREAFGKHPHLARSA